MVSPTAQPEKFTALDRTAKIAVVSILVAVTVMGIKYLAYLKTGSVRSTRTRWKALSTSSQPSLPWFPSESVRNHPTRATPTATTRSSISQPCWKVR